MKKADGTNTGNKLISLRLPQEVEKALGEGMDITGLKRSAFVRLAIVEKTEREKIKTGN